MLKNFPQYRFYLAMVLSTIGLPIIWQVLGEQNFFYVFLGHLSFVITFLAYAQKDLIRLRLVAIASLIVGMVYNSYVHINMPPGQDLWPVLFWQGVFLIQNTVNSIAEIRRNMEVPLSTRQRALMVACVPGMHSQDWLQFEKLATLRSMAPDDVFLPLGGHTQELTILVSGTCMEVRPEYESLERRAGTFWGESTYVLGEKEFYESPCKIVAGRLGATVLQWKYADVEALEQRNKRFSAALRSGILIAAIYKHANLKRSTSDSLGTALERVSGRVEPQLALAN